MSGGPYGPGGVLSDFGGGGGSNGKKRKKQGHWCKDNADGKTAKDDMAVLDQPPPVQDVADEVEQRERQL